MPQDRVKCRFVVPTVVVNPTPDYRVEHARHVIQRLVTTLLKLPAPNLAPNRFKRFVANRRAERDSDPDSTLRSSCQPRPKRIAEEVELLVGVVSTSVIILALDDLRLFGMKLKPTFSESLFKPRA